MTDRIIDRIKGITKQHVSGTLFFISMAFIKYSIFFGLGMMVLAGLALAYKEKKDVHNTA